MGAHICPWWLAYTFDNPLRKFFHQPDQIFAPYIKEGMTVADIGCGFGWFAIGLAKAVKKNGKVIAVDIQPKMLAKAKKRALQAGVSDTIQFQLCEANNLNISEPLDFALAFWMVHETPDIPNFLAQANAALKPAGLLLMTEPRFHVSSSQFQQEIETALRAGFTIKDEPAIRFSHAVVFEKQ